MATLLLATWQEAILQSSFTPAASATLYLPSTTTLVAVYSDIAGTVMSNPFPVGQGAGSFGIDVLGNIGFAAVPGKYDLLVGGIRFPVNVTVQAADIAAHFDDPNGHNLQNYVDGNFLASSDLGQPGGPAQLDNNGVMVTGQVLMSVSS